MINMDAVKEARSLMSHYQVDLSRAILINNNAIVHLGGTRTNVKKAVDRWIKMGKEVKLLGND